MNRDMNRDAGSGGRNRWVHKGFEGFSQGTFEHGGTNLYVNAHGVVETIHRYDLNNDGYVDLILPNSHGYVERGPTWIYKREDEGGEEKWTCRELPNDSGWLSRIADVDGDGYPDLIVVNGENGVTSELNSYVYWGGPNGLSGERTELPTAGAYDVAVVDVNRDGMLDLIFPSAWVDHHNAGRPRLSQVYIQAEPRTFQDEKERYGLFGVAATSVACDDLNGDGYPDIVLANYRSGYEYDTDSFVYWGTRDGFDPAPLRLPSHYAMQVILGDLNEDGRKEIIFCGWDQVWVYWNDNGAFSPENRTILQAAGIRMLLGNGPAHADIADVNGDRRNELILATNEGVEIRLASDLQSVHAFLEMPYAGWVHAADLDGDGFPEIIASKYQNGVTYESESAIFWSRAGEFSTERVSLLPTAAAVGCTAGDLDGDGIPEVVFNSTLRGYSQFFPGFPMYAYMGGEGQDYGPDRRLELPTGGGTNVYVMADLDLDGYPDLAITTIDGLRIFPGGPDGPRPDRYVDLPKRLGAGTAGVSMEVLSADFNGDGWLDLLLGVQTYDDKPETVANSSMIFFGSAEGYSSERSVVLPTFCNGQMHLADVNNDGFIDIVCGDKRGYVAIYLGGPDGYSPDRMWKIPIQGGIIGSTNSADLNGNGWLDILVEIPGHYVRQPSGFCIIHGGPDGYSPDSVDYHFAGATTGRIAVADINNDGHLDLLVPAYSSQFTRELPAHIFLGNGTSFDFEHPIDIPCDSSCAFMPIDITGNGYLDLFVVCHRNDLGHQVDSYLIFNGPDGLEFDRMVRVPGLGPHGASVRDFGNSFTREPNEYYTSPVYDTCGRRPVRISWEASVPTETSLKFQLRSADTEEELRGLTWRGPEGEGSFYEIPGQDIRGVAGSARWIQYRAVFTSPNGCSSPGLSQVSVELE